MANIWDFISIFKFWKCISFKELTIKELSIKGLSRPNENHRDASLYERWFLVWHSR